MPRAAPPAVAYRQHGRAGGWQVQSRVAAGCHSYLVYSLLASLAHRLPYRLLDGIQHLGLYPLGITLSAMVGQRATVLKDGDDQGGKIAAARVVPLIDVALDPVKQSQERHVLAHMDVQRGLRHVQARSPLVAQAHQAVQLQRQLG